MIQTVKYIIFEYSEHLSKKFPCYIKQKSTVFVLVVLVAVWLSGFANVNKKEKAKGEEGRYTQRKREWESEGSGKKRSQIEKKKKEVKDIFVF